MVERAEPAQIIAEPVSDLARRGDENGEAGP